ncbi:MAG: beta-ketoacyl-ACP synthase II [Pseudomonadota bacterium]|nr:beta-ketoacyl-ACP synthase II [Pseudomonadota bacterium]
MARRVVITGLGAVTPVGADATSTWAAMCEARSGVTLVSRFDTAGFPVRIAAEVKNFDGEAHLGRKLAKRLDLFAQYALVATNEACKHAGIARRDGGDPRLGVYVGTGIGGLQEIVLGARMFDAEGYRGLSPFFIPRALTNLAAGHIAIEYGAQGPSLCVTTACATGNHSIGEAWRAIRYGDADVVVAGGSEAAITPVGIAGFMVMKALSKRNDDPSTACRPFDNERDGFVMGEGAGIVILEELEHARARGVEILAELVGYSLTNDAHHDTAPAPGGAGAVRCMRLALASAGVDPTEVDYINAHGTSTPQNDSSETQAIKTVFGDHARRVLISSTKGVTGHLLGAAGGVEAVAAVRALHSGVVPPTANLVNPDPACDLDYVPGVARKANPRIVVSNAFGFGGTNASLVFRRWEE